MDRVLLNDIPFEPNLGRLLQILHVRAGSQEADTLAKLSAEAQAVARPKALYRLARIDAKEDNAVIVDGVTLTSRVLRVNLDSAHRIFVYVATCGAELDQWSEGIDDMLASYWAYTIKEMALRAAMKALDQDLVQRYEPGPTATMNPGSLADWPIQEQSGVFSLLDDASQAIGVRLQPSYLMLPTMSVSGIRFPTEEHFASCQLCPMEDCPGRRAPYDQDLFARKYASQAA
jgi:hypothetical protein